MYNLPHEYTARVADYDELLGYLRGIASSDVSINVSVGRSPDSPYFEARGKLRPSKDRSSGGRFVINTDASRDEGGSISVGEMQFRGGHLYTSDGDDYFLLAIELDGVVLRIQDTNYP